LPKKIKSCAFQVRGAPFQNYGTSTF